MLAWAAVLIVGPLALFYPLCHLAGAVLDSTSGAIVAAYPAALESRLATRHETYLRYAAVPQCAIDGTVSVEDARFFSHPGIDPIAIVRLVLANFRDDRQDHGGSTITQQLARMIVAEPRRQPSVLSELRSELRVVAYALVVEHDFSKDEILELYLNGAYYGRGAHGFAQAAQTYFRTDAAHLATDACYYLTGLVQAPSYYGRNPDAARERYRHVVGTLRRHGYISEAQAQRLEAEAPLASRTPRSGRSAAPAD